MSEEPLYSRGEHAPEIDLGAVFFAFSVAAVLVRVKPFQVDT